MDLITDIRNDIGILNGEEDSTIVEIVIDDIHDGCGFGFLMQIPRPFVLQAK